MATKTARSVPSQPDTVTATSISPVFSFVDPTRTIGVTARALDVLVQGAQTVMARQFDLAFTMLDMSAAAFDAGPAVTVEKQLTRNVAMGRDIVEAGVADARAIGDAFRTCAYGLMEIACEQTRASQTNTAPAPSSPPKAA